MSAEETQGWTENDSETFIKYGHCFVPEREEQLMIITELLATQQGEFHVVDLCTGAGLFAEAILNKYPKAIVHLYDASNTMLEAAALRIEKFKGRSTLNEFDLFSNNWRKFDFPVSAFISSLALHHLDGKQKQQLYQNLYDSLSTGGVFANADFIMPTNRTGLDIAARSWNDETKRRSTRFFNDLSAYEAFNQLDWNYFIDPAADPVDKPSSVFEQLCWLNEIGYKDVDVYWLKAGHAVYAGLKENLDTSNSKEIK